MVLLHRGQTLSRTSTALVFGSTPHIAQDQTTVAGELAVDMALDVLVVVVDLLLVGAVVTHPAARITADELRRWLNRNRSRSTWAILGVMNLDSSVPELQTTFRASVIAIDVHLSVNSHHASVVTVALQLMTTAMIATNKLLGKLDRLHSSFVEVDGILNQADCCMSLSVESPGE